MRSDNKRIAKNTLALYVRMAVILLITLYTSRVVLNTLGASDYGIYNIVGGIVVLFSFINTALASSTQRFLNFELGRGDLTKLKEVFNASLHVHILIIITIAVLAETIGLWFVCEKLSIPDGRMSAAIWVYHLSVITFCVNVFRAPFNAAIIAKEKMQFYAYVSIIEAVLKLVIVYMLLSAPFDKLVYYGCLTLTVNTIVTLTYIFYCKKNFIFIIFKSRSSWTTMKPMLGFSVWACFGNISNIVSSQGLNIILNLFWGVTVNAAMGIANQVSSAVYGFVGNFQTAFNPQIVKLYAAKEIGTFNKLVYRASKVSFFLYWILLLPMLLNSYFILELWLKNVPDYTDAFVKIILIDNICFALSGPLWMAAQATGKIRNYMLTVGILNMMSLPFSYFALRLGCEPTSVIWVKMCFDTSTYIYRLFFMRKETGLSLGAYFVNAFMPIALVSIITLPLPLILCHFLDQGIIRLLSTTVVTTVTIALATYYLGLSKSERGKVVELVKVKLRK